MRFSKKRFIIFTFFFTVWEGFISFAMVKYHEESI